MKNRSWFIYFYKFVTLIGYYEKMKELESIYNSFLAGSRITTDSREVKQEIYSLP